MKQFSKSARISNAVMNYGYDQPGRVAFGARIVGRNVLIDICRNSEDLDCAKKVFEAILACLIQHDLIKCIRPAKGRAFRQRIMRP